MSYASRRAGHLSLEGGRGGRCIAVEATLRMPLVLCELRDDSSERSVPGFMSSPLEGFIPKIRYQSILAVMTAGGVEICIFTEAPLAGGGDSLVRCHPSGIPGWQCRLRAEFNFPEYRLSTLPLGTLGVYLADPGTAVAMDQLRHIELALDYARGDHDQLRFNLSRSPTRNSPVGKVRELTVQVGGLGSAL